MIARSRAVIAAGGKLAELACQPPLTLRQVAGGEAGTCALCLVGTAAGPLAGDDLELELVVGPGARACLTAAGAHIAQGRAGREAEREAGPDAEREAEREAAGREAERDCGSSLRFAAVVAAGGALRADPGPLIVRPGGRVDTATRIDLAADAAVDWRELVVLGAAPTVDRPARGGPARGGPARGGTARGGTARGGAGGGGSARGAARLRWDVTRDGRAVLRQAVDLMCGDARRWAGMTGGRRVLASALLAGPTVAARTIVATPEAVAQELAADAVLVTVLADDAAAALAQRDDLCARLLSQPVSRRSA